MRNLWLFLVLCLCSAAAHAGKDTVVAPTRNNATNFKDRVLAYCIARAYKDSPAGQDATKTGGIFLDWTYYDVTANPALDELIAQYLGRDYSTPVEGYADAKFALLKCIDMYHSKELNQLVRKYVPHPDWIGNKPGKEK